jgi:acyl-CoA synthetase (AMP-forming)/AMP-acid ligase II
LIALDQLSFLSWQVYGMTELSPIVLAGGEHDHVPGSSGRLVANTALKIIAPETGEALPLGAEGELLIRGPQVMLGYKDRPDANAEVLLPVSKAERLVGGAELGAWWLRTGDVAKVDAEGNVYISERLKELIKVHADGMRIVSCCKLLTAPRATLKALPTRTRLACKCSPRRLVPVHRSRASRSHLLSSRRSF